MSGLSVFRGVMEEFIFMSGDEWVVRRPRNNNPLYFVIQENTRRLLYA
jgi:hypothetical protein